MDHPGRGAPTPGPKQQVWQLQRAGNAAGDKTRVHLVVVPEQARELKLEVERQIAEWRTQGEEELDTLLEELSCQIAAWLAQQAEQQASQCLQGNVLIIGALFSLTLWPRFRRRRIQ